MPFFTHNSVVLHYQTVGSGPPLLILGGLGDNTRNWYGIASQLAKLFTVITPDHRDAGQSQKFTEPYSLDDMVQDAAALIRHLNIVRTAVLGFSMGGKIAMALAIKRPELVSKLILVATGPGWHEPFSPTKDALDILENPQNTPEHYEKQYGILYSAAHRAKFPASGFIKYKQSDPYPQSTQSYRNQLHAVKSADLREQIQNITQPTLILSGSDDTIASADNARWMQNKIPNSRLVIYQDAGHIVVGERTKDFIRDVGDFLLTNP